jgi:outer membrane protein
VNLVYLIAIFENLFLKYYIMGQMKHFVFLAFTFCLGLNNILTAQKIWKLEDCINYAFENNLQIKQQVLNTRYNSNQLLQSKIGLAPDLNAGIGTGVSWGRALDETTYEFTQNETIISGNANASSSLTLFSGLQQYNTIKQNEFNLMASLQDLEKLKNDISLAIAAGYLQILFNTELMTVSKNQLELTRMQVSRTSKLVDAGSLARGSLLAIEAQAATEELNVINASNQLDIAYLTLTQLLDLDSVGGFQIEIPEFGDIADQEILLTVNSVFNEANTILPQIKSAEYQLSSSEKSLGIARGARMPSINLSANFGSGYSDNRKKYNPATGQFDLPYAFSDQMLDNRSTNLSLGLRIPIFNGWMVGTNISNAKLTVMNSQLALETARNNLYKEIQQAYADAVAARKKYLATEQALTSMEESFMYTEQKFEVGLVNTVDYNTEKNRLTQTQSDLLQAKYDYIFKMKILDFYRGISLTL